MNFHRFFLAGLIAVLLVLVTFVSTSRDPFSQRDFPCNEDQVLGFAPGHVDDVVCITIKESQ